MNICIFPGTFNPIHRAHLKMAEVVLEKFKFDKIIFIPAYIPPHKELNMDLAIHRFNMVRIAIASNPKFDISDIEYQSEGKSYSLITVRKIKNEYNIKGKLNFLIGTDAFKNIKNWYKVDELKDLVHFIVYPRGNDIIDKNKFEEFDYEIINADTIDISSTELRKKQKEYTIKPVKDYVEKYELYN